MLEVAQTEEALLVMLVVEVLEEALLPIHRHVTARLRAHRLTLEVTQVRGHRVRGHRVRGQ